MTRLAPLTVALALAVLGCGSGDDDGALADASGASVDASGVTIDAPVTAGCTANGAPTGVLNESITIRGMARTYVLAVPSDYDPTRPYTVVFAWHGRGSNAAQARGYFGVEEASAGAAIFVYPDGLPRMELGGDSGWALASDGEDVELFDGLLERVSGSYCVNSARVFSTGHSFGGYMSNTLGCARAAVLAGIAPVAGGGPFGGCGTIPIPAMLIHGSNDTVVPISQGEGSRTHWRGINGCSDQTETASPSPCEAHTGCTGAPLWWCQHADTTFAGHWWPAFAAAGIWSFFDAQ